MKIDITLKITPKMVTDAQGNEKKALVGHLGTHFDVMNKEFPLEYTERKGIVLGSADETNEAKMPSSEVKRDLYLGDNEPIYYSERVTFDENGDPVEYSENSYIASRYKYNIRLKKVRG